jgi:hypothetical protein
VSLEYDPPGGKAGELVAELVKDSDKQVERAVENFRKVVEGGGLGAAGPARGRAVPAWVQEPRAASDPSQRRVLWQWQFTGREESRPGISLGSRCGTLAGLEERLASSPAAPATGP